MKIVERHFSGLGLNFPARGHFRPLVAGLLEAGFSLSAIPYGGAIKRNGEMVALQTPNRDLRFRVFIYKVTVSSRGRPNERRVEITNTYPKRNLSRVSGSQDVVLGWDYDNDVFVGLDPKRLEHGGSTGNASSFFDGEGITLPRRDEILVRPHRSSIFPEGFEFHAFFKRQCIADYLCNIHEIHAGQYRGETFLSGKVHYVLKPLPRQNEELTFRVSKLSHKQPVSKKKVRLVEEQDLKRIRRHISAKEFAEIQRTCDENGRLGEEFVLDREKLALVRAGRSDLAQKVRWVSETSVFEGYDILSFFPDGQKKYVEVKSTSGDKNVFKISISEWDFGSKHGESYVICRVTHVTSKRPQLKSYQNIRALEAAGQLTKAASGWTVTLK